MSQSNSENYDCQHPGEMFCTALANGCSTPSLETGCRKTPGIMHKPLAKLSVDFQ